MEGGGDYSSHCARVWGISDSSCGQDVATAGDVHLLHLQQLIVGGCPTGNAGVLGTSPCSGHQYCMFHWRAVGLYDFWLAGGILLLVCAAQWRGAVCDASDELFSTRLWVPSS